MLFLGEKKEMVKVRSDSHQNCARDCSGPPPNRAPNPPEQKLSPAPPEIWELESYPPHVTWGFGRLQGCSGLWYMTPSPPE